MSQPAKFSWTFHTPFPEQTGAFVALARAIADEQATELKAARREDGVVLYAGFEGEEELAEERGRAYWAELHSRSLDQNLAMELVENFEPEGGWQALGEVAIEEEARLAPRRRADDALARQRPAIAAEPLYDILRGDDPDMDRNLEETIHWIEGQGLPVINLLSYLELPLFTGYAAEHEDERDQNLFLHMLHTWTCYRRFEAVHARVPEALAEAFDDPKYLRINTTMFRSPAPALCVQFEDWSEPVRGVGGRPMQWAKEVYITHFEPPTPAEERELTLMFITYDENGEFGFIPLELPLSLPAVDESIDAFFAPSEGDEELGANTEDLKRLTRIATTYCLYATARDPARYLHS